MSHQPFVDGAPICRRDFARQFAAAGALLLAALTRPAAAERSGLPNGATPVTVFKDPLCGCCQLWVAHLAAAGFRPSVQDVADVDAIKARYGVPAALRSCHTAVVEGFVVEGHVPAADIHRLLRERPTIAGAVVRGLAVPGMPAGSPGMEGARAERYDVTAFTADGSTRRFAAH